jgi:uncharacterized protein
LLPLLFDWDASNVSHIARHGVRPEEAEEALLDPGRVGAAAYDVLGEERSAYIGVTEGERLLFVVVTHRRRRIRVVTARDASARNRLHYQTYMVGDGPPP